MAGIVYAIDPGPTQSGWVLYEPGRVVDAGVADNHDLLVWLKATRADVLAIEMIENMGMPVGREVFETVRWIGRFQQAWREPAAVRFVTRREVKLHLCGNMRAKDANIRQALLDLIGPVGSKKAPGPCYGVKSHAWSALAVAVVAARPQPEIAA